MFDVREVIIEMSKMTDVYIFKPKSITLTKCFQLKNMNSIYTLRIITWVEKALCINRAQIFLNLDSSEIYLLLKEHITGFTLNELSFANLQ